jgi:hypothetical protein
MLLTKLTHGFVGWCFIVEKIRWELEYVVVKEIYEWR